MIANIDAVAGRKVGYGDIEKLSKVFDDSAARLEELIAALESDLAEVKQSHLRALRSQAVKVAEAEAELNGAVASAPELFKKPRTITVHGVKVGFSLAEGKLVFDDADSTVKLIQKHRKEEADLLVRTKTEPDKDAIKRLVPADELRQIGCRIEGAGDQVVVKRETGDVEKLMDKLMKKLVEAMVEG